MSHQGLQFPVDIQSESERNALYSNGHDVIAQSATTTLCSLLCASSVKNTSNDFHIQNNIVNNGEKKDNGLCPNRVSQP